MIWGLAGALVLVAAGLAAHLASLTPSSDLEWAADHAVQARISFEGDRVLIRDLRDFRHGPDGDFEEVYRDVTVELDSVRRVWLVLSPFARRWRGPAHSFLSFELADGDAVAISAEARRESHEAYSLTGGMLRRFETTYVVGTEDDLLGVRALRGDTLYLYPARATPEQARELFVDMLERAERLRSEPEFYHTLLNNCSTNLRTHVNRLIADPLPYGWGVLLPGYSDEMALEHGLLDTDLPIAEARERFRVDRRVRDALAAGDPVAPTVRRGLRPGE